ncbi:hypothetical protein VTO42DRAFT_8140 [Malbranchea cinnamomea]
MANVAIVGGTGLVGANIVNTLLALPTVAHIDFIARRPPTNETTEELIESHPGKLSRFISTEPPATWAAHIRSFHPRPEIFFSSLATTRANAGGLGPQFALEHDANLELARAAKEAGSRVYVLISAVGADASSMVAYNRMKGQIEKSILDLGFEKTVIVRPGLILGTREESRPLEYAIRGIGNVMASISKPWLSDWWAQDASEIARAAVSAGMKALEDTGTEGQQKVTILNGKDIIRLGRTEWKAT